MPTLKKGDRVCFTNAMLHKLDKIYPLAGAEGEFKGYSRPDKSRAWVQWDENQTKDDGLWACLVSDLVVMNRAVDDGVPV